MKTIGVRLDGEAIRTLRDRAVENGQTISETVRSIIMDAQERERLESRLSTIEVRLNGLVDAFREMDGLRRFRSLYAQTKRTTIAVDELVRALLGDQKYAGWKTVVDKAMKEAATQVVSKIDK